MSKQKFGTAPVFFTAISTILGAIMFLRFGFAVGMVGLAGTMAIILIGHAVTIPTAMAIAEIATNQKVEGGGEYYIISRSFGLVIGSTIGIALYMSQAISVAFYIMAFTEAFKPLVDWVINTYPLLPWAESLLQRPQTIGIPALLLLTWLILSKGADLGVKVLYTVVFTLAIALLAFFIGSTEYAENNAVDFFNSYSADVEATATAIETLVEENAPPDTVYLDGEEATMNAAKPAEPGPDIPNLSFFTVFAIIFPAFTGMTAGVGLSGDRHGHLLLHGLEALCLRSAGSTSGYQPPDNGRHRLAGLVDHPTRARSSHHLLRPGLHSRCSTDAAGHCG